MKVLPTVSGMMLHITPTELGKLAAYAKDTDYSARDILETYTQIASANFDEDIKSAIESLDEQALDREAGNA